MEPAHAQLASETTTGGSRRRRTAASDLVHPKGFEPVSLLPQQPASTRRPEAGQSVGSGW